MAALVEIGDRISGRSDSMTLSHQRQRGAKKPRTNGKNNSGSLLATLLEQTQIASMHAI